MLKIVGAQRLMAISTTLWGAVTIGTAFVTNWGQLMAVRVLLGAFEAGESKSSSATLALTPYWLGLFPCVNMYISMTYRPEEQGRRLSYVFSCAAIRCGLPSPFHDRKLMSSVYSGAFGGLLAFGLTQIKGGALASWQYL